MEDRRRRLSRFDARNGQARAPILHWSLPKASSAPEDHSRARPPRSRRVIGLVAVRQSRESELLRDLAPFLLKVGARVMRKADAAREIAKQLGFPRLTH